MIHNVKVRVLCNVTTAINLHFIIHQCQ